MKSNIIATLAICFLLVALNLAVAKAIPTNQKSELGFVENVGQIKNQFGEINKGVLYVFRNKNFQVQLRETGFSYEVIERKNSAIGLDESKNQSTDIKRIDIDFVNALVGFNNRGEQALAGKITMHSPDDVSKVYAPNQYKKVVYENVYEGIDLEFLVSEADGKSANQIGFKYNFIIHPGANLSNIKLKVSGAKGSVDKLGSLKIANGKIVLEDRIPISYETDQQGRFIKKIQASFVQINEHIFGFKANQVDPKQTLVIDPLLWSTYFGGNQGEVPTGICSDPSGNIYLTGRTNSDIGIATTGAYQTTYGGGTTFDSYIAKFSASGSLVWATYFGGSDDDIPADMEVDKFGNVVVIGFTSSTTGIATASAFQPNLGGGSDGYIAKFTPSGSIVWATYFGYSGNEILNGLCIDKDADIYFTGNTNSAITLLPGVHQTSNAGAADVIFVKITASGSLSKATYYGGPSNDYAMDICVDAQKNIYFAGYSLSLTGIASTGAFQTTTLGGYEGVYAKFDSLFQRVFGTYFGGTGLDYIQDIEWDSEGKLVIAGYTTSTSGIASAGSYQSTFGGGTTDGFVMRMSTTNSTPLWSTYAGSVGTDYLWGIGCDKQGNSIAIGNTSSISGIATVDGFQTSIGGLTDAYLIKFTKDGTKSWGSYFGGSQNDNGREIALDISENMLFAGETNSSAGIASVGASKTNITGSQDSYLAKYGNTPSTSSITNNIISSGQGLCLGNAAKVITGGTPAGGDGTFSYKWLSSNTGATGSFIDAALPNTFDTYSPGAIGINTYYKRVVFSGTDSDTSNTCAIIVSNDITAGFTVNKTIQCAKGNQFIFTDTTKTSKGVLFHYWDFGNGITSTKAIDTISYIQSADNVFKIKLITLLNGGCGDTLFRSVFVINNPLAKSITGKDTVNKGSTETYTVPTTTGSAFNWVKNNGTGNSLQSSINIKWTQLGNTQLKMVEQSGGGCWGDTSTKNIYVKSSLGGEELAVSTFEIYPNPSTGRYFISGLNQELVLVEIVDTYGNNIFSNWVEPSSGIDISQQPQGIYLLTLTTPSGQQMHQRIVLMKP